MLVYKTMALKFCIIIESKSQKMNTREFSLIMPVVWNRVCYWLLSLITKVKRKEECIPAETFTIVASLFVDTSCTVLTRTFLAFINVWELMQVLQLLLNNPLWNDFYCDKTIGIPHRFDSVARDSHYYINFAFVTSYFVDIRCSVLTRIFLYSSIS